MGCKETPPRAETGDRASPLGPQESRTGGWKCVLVSARHTRLLICSYLLLLTVARPDAAALPDATILGILAEATSICEGVEVPLSVQVSNAGTEALASVPVTLSVDGVPRAEWSSPAELQAGETASWKVVWVASAGEHVVAATIDPLNDVRELDETNNAAFLRLVAVRPMSFPWATLGLGAIGLALGFWVGVLLRRAQARRRALSQPSARDEDVPPES